MEAETILLILKPHRIFSELSILVIGLDCQKDQLVYLWNDAPTPDSPQTSPLLSTFPEPYTPCGLKIKAIHNTAGSSSFTVTPGGVIFFL